MRTLRFHRYGDPADVLVLEDTDLPAPAAGRIRVAVHACGLTPADWALCGGLFPGSLPRGVGLEVAGVVDAVGAGVVDVAVGHRVLGTPDFMGAPVAGASDFAVLDHWARIADNLAFDDAAALPMAIETAARSMDQLRVRAGQALLLNGAGSTIGFAAVQVAIMRGAKVVATAGDTYAAQLQALGAQVTRYGDGVVERVLALHGGPLDLAFDASPHTAKTPSAIPDLIRIVGGDPQRVLTISDFAGAAQHGARSSFSEAKAAISTDGKPTLAADAIANARAQRSAVLAQYAALAAEGRMRIPIARAFPLEQWREAMAISRSGSARGKIILRVR